MRYSRRTKYKHQTRTEIDRTEYINIVAIKALAGYDREYVRKYMDRNYILMGGKDDTTT